MKIIGITGPAAAGKWTVVEYLKELWFSHYSASGFLTQELEKQGKEVNRDTMRELADSLRAQYGPSYVIEQLYNQAKEKNEDAILESVRTVWEIELLRKKDPWFILLSVDADQRLRYQRAVERKSSKDNVSFEKFCEQEELEKANQDPNKWNISACQTLADISIVNNWSIEELYHQIEEGLSRFEG